MGAVFGDATDFWRLRLVRVDESNEPDLEWRDDILYRKPLQGAVDEAVVYRVDAVSVDADERVIPLRQFADSQSAHDYLEVAQRDLSEMTKSEFERAHFDPARGVGTAIESE